MLKKLSFGTIFKDFFDFYKQSFSSYYSAIKAMNWAQFSTRAVSSLLICIAFALFCSLKEGTGDLYMNIFLPLFFTNSLIILYSCINKSSDLFALLTVFLTTAGTSLQIFMLPATENGSLSEVKSFVFIILIAIVASVFVIPLVQFLCSMHNKNKLAIGLMFTVTILVYATLLIFGTEVNGTKAWITIGTLSLQLTELTKVAAFISFPIIMLDKSLSEKAKSKLLICLLCLHALFLVLINELGTLCIIFLTYFIIRVLFTSQRKYIIRELAVFLLLASVTLAGCFGVYKLYSPQSEQTETAQEQQVNSELAENSAVITEETTVSQYENNENDAESQEDEEKNSESAFDKIISRVANIFPKLEKRVRVFLRTDDVDEADLYQIKMAENALTVVSFFGTPRGSLSMVPEVDCDFVFIYLIVRLGIIGSILVFITLITMLIEVVIKSYLFDKNAGGYMTAFAFISSIVVQALLCSCSNIGLFPIVGLPFPFLSAGGTAISMNILMSLFIINMLGCSKSKESCNNDEA